MLFIAFKRESEQENNSYKALKHFKMENKYEKNHASADFFDTLSSLIQCSFIHIRVSLWICVLVRSHSVRNSIANS